MKSNMNIVGKRKIFFTISLAIVAVTILVSVIFGVKRDIQFTGGAIITYSYQGELDKSSFESEMKAALDGQHLNLQYSQNSATGKQNVVISLPNSGTISIDKVSSIQSMLDEKFAANELTQESIDSVDPTMGGEFFLKCIAAVVFAAVLMILFIALRFRKIGGWSAGVMAVVALLHDVVMVFAVFTLCRIPLNDNFIAVVLTILGYSINDTIVIYDRIRENTQLHRSMPVAERVNLSINQSFVRTMNTTITTVMAMSVVCIVALIFNVTTILTFAFPMIVGMISGVYSSLCISGPLWVVWQEHKAKKKAEAAKAPKASKTKKKK